MTEIALSEARAQLDAAADLLPLYTQHRAALLRFLRARTGSAAEAEDVLQELWLRITAGRPGTVANGRAYLFQMANHLVLDRVRGHQRRLRREQQWTEVVQLQVPLEEAEATAPEPAVVEALMEQEELAQLAAAVAELPERSQQVFQLHKLEERSHAEVAARLGISRSGVEKHIALAMKRLRRALRGMR